MMDDSEWMDLEEAAALVGRTPRQMLRYGKAGRVATRREGRRLQYRRDDVEALAESLEGDVTTRHDIVAPDVGRALVEVVSVQRELIGALHRIDQLRGQVEELRAENDRQRDRFLGIIRKLVERSIKSPGA